MAFRTIVISNPSRLFIKNNNLCIGQNEEVYNLPIEDISSIMIENKQTTITSGVLELCAENNVLIYSCDNKHLPNGIFTSLNQHSRVAKVLKTQIDLPKPFKKRCWQKIIIQKTVNQAECLNILKIDGSEKIINIANNIKSGDTDNREAYIAREYFKLLFGSSFTRGTKTTTNAALNYGYSIIRGAVARSLVSYGYNTILGINHSSELNSFNLADDFMEVYRALVDLYVKKNIVDDNEFTSDNKMQLYNLLNVDVIIDNKKCSVINSIDIMIQSFSTAITTGDFENLKLPKLIDLEIHKYE